MLPTGDWSTLIRLLSSQCRRRTEQKGVNQKINTIGLLRKPNGVTPNSVFVSLISPPTSKSSPTDLTYTNLSKTNSLARVPSIYFPCSSLFEKAKKYWISLLGWQHRVWPSPSGSAKSAAVNYRIHYGAVRAGSNPARRVPRKPLESETINGKGEEKCIRTRNQKWRQGEFSL